MFLCMCAQFSVSFVVLNLIGLNVIHSFHNHSMHVGSFRKAAKINVRKIIDTLLNLWFKWEPGALCQAYLCG